MIGDSTAEADFVRTVLAMAEEAPGRLNAEAVADGVTQSCFTDSKRWRIYEAAKKNARGGQRATMETIGAMVPDIRDYVSQAWPDVPVYHGYKTLAAKLREYAARRSAFEIGKRIQVAAENPSEDIGGSLVSAASALNGAYTADGSGIVSGHSVMLSFLDELEAAQTGAQAKCIETGVAEWDRVMGGLERGILTAIAGYPGAWKTGLAATMAGNMSFRGIPVGYISLEDRPENIAKRYMARETGISVKDLTRRRLAEYEMEKVGNGFDAMRAMLEHIHFDGRKGLTGAEVAASARFLTAEKGCQVVFVDLLTEIRSTERQSKRGDGMAYDKGEGVTLLRDVSSELNVSVVLLSHLSRPGEKDGAEFKKPNKFSFADTSYLEKQSKAAAGLYKLRADDQFQACVNIKNTSGGDEGTPFFLEKHPVSVLFKNVNSRKPKEEEESDTPWGQ